MARSKGFICPAAYDKKRKEPEAAEQWPTIIPCRCTSKTGYISRYGGVIDENPLPSFRKGIAGFNASLGAPPERKSSYRRRPGGNGRLCVLAMLMYLPATPAGPLPHAAA